MDGLDHTRLTFGTNEIEPTYDFVGLSNYFDVLSGAEGTFYSRPI